MTKREQPLKQSNASIPTTSELTKLQVYGKNMREISKQVESLDLDLNSLKYRGQNGKSAFSLLLNDIIKSFEDNGEFQGNNEFLEMTQSEIRKEFKKRGVPYSQIANKGYNGLKGLTALRSYALEHFDNEIKSLQETQEEKTEETEKELEDQNKEESLDLYSRLGLVCSTCGFTAPNRSALEEHSDEQGHEIPRMLDLSQENTENSSIEANALCGMCGFQAQTIDELERHIDKIHRETSEVSSNGLFDMDLLD